MPQPANNIMAAAAPAVLIFNSIREQPHRQSIKIRAIIIENDAIISGQQIGGLADAIRLQQTRHNLVGGPPLTLWDQPKLPPFGHRLPHAVPLKNARTACGIRSAPNGVPILTCSYGHEN